MRSWLVAFFIPLCVPAQTDRRILVVTASSGDYIFGAGGTLVKFMREGWRIDVLQMGNEEKFSTGGNQAQTRLANVQEARAAAKLLGVRDLVMMDHKSGELGYVSSTEMRNQAFGLIRHIKPRILFIPDPYVTFQTDRDRRYVGLMAEEGWGYSGGGTFANELARMGFPPYGAPEIFYYSAERPYRSGEGGVRRAKFVVRDIADTIEHKTDAAELLNTRNAAWVARRAGLADMLGVRSYVRSFIEQLARESGAKHGLGYAEEFNHVGLGEAIPDYALERARKKR
jgi:LmbE family N-acetylglucosaminyl deacetylase